MTEKGVVHYNTQLNKYYFKNCMLCTKDIALNISIQILDFLIEWIGCDGIIRITEADTEIKNNQFLLSVLVNEKLLLVEKIIFFILPIILLLWRHKIRNKS